MRKIKRPCKSGLKPLVYKFTYQDADQQDRYNYDSNCQEYRRQKMPEHCDYPTKDR